MLHEKILPGICLSKGSAVGPLFFLPVDEKKIAGFSITLSEVDGEIARYRQALFSSRQDLCALKNHLSSSNEVATIIDSHLSMLEDPLMTEEIEEEIRNSLQTPESVFQNVIGAYQKRFSKQTNSFFQQRMDDVADLAHRVLNHLSSEKEVEWEIPKGAIVLAHDLTPLQVASLASLSVAGVVTKRGGKQSHAALIAKAKALPYLAGIDIEVCKQETGSLALLNADRGHLILHPEQTRMSAYIPAPACLSTPSTCATGKNPTSCFLNISDPSEYKENNSSEGIGLFRTEYLLLQNPSLAFSCEQQKRIYDELLNRTNSLPCTFRLFDVGGDKTPPMWEDEMTRSLFGLRGIRFLLAHPQILHIQLKALLQGTSKTPIRLLIPFISDVSEVLAMKAAIQKLEGPLRPYLLGAMIELPSAALSVDSILQEVDFVSIGTNDLIQYTLGVDRQQEESLPLGAHPSILFLLHRVIKAATLAKKEVSICGDLGSDPLFIPLLLSLGCRHFSVSPDSFADVRKKISTLCIQEQESKLKAFLSCKQTEEILSLLQSYEPISLNGN